MNRSQQRLGMMWVLGSIQYCTCLFGGGALWLLAAQLTDGFGGNLLTQTVAGLLLLALIAGEAWWAYIPPVKHPAREFLVDCLSSAAIAGFGMAVVLAILLWVPHR